MINHISFGVNNPEKVANILAELWGGVALPFPPSPGGWVAFADDGRGTIVELIPIDVQLIPGTGYPDEATFTKETPTDEFEGTFEPGNDPSLFGSSISISTRRSMRNRSRPLQNARAGAVSPQIAAAGYSSSSNFGSRTALCSK